MNSNSLKQYPMSSEPLTQRREWKALEDHLGSINTVHMNDLFSTDPQRFDKFHLKTGGLLFDYSKNLITEDTLDLLVSLARSCDVEGWRRKMCDGAAINESENRAVLHMALRGSTDKSLTVDGKNVSDFVSENLEKIKAISEAIRKDKTITDVVNIGIGGSDLGPHMTCEALKDFADGPNVHFVSNVDDAHLSQTLKILKQETTIFLIASKTFTTMETMHNAQAAKKWLGKASPEKHIYAITANESGANDFGVPESNILPLREWIGGRYSLWSAVGIPIAIATGFKNFKALLDGAHTIDRHFMNEPLEKNMPVIMALLSLWYRNFHGLGSLAILPYAQNLHRFPAHIQQLDMESNGKNVDRDGQTVNYATSPVIFGEPGTGCQHAFFQLLHQGTDVIPCDFIAVKDTNTKTLGNALAQAQALMQGNGHDQEPYRIFKGNRPSNMLLMETLDPYHLGMLLALYEHKTFVQGIIWNINSFDQWGVELGKTLAKNIIGALEKENNINAIDSSTQALLSHVKKV